MISKSRSFTLLVPGVEGLDLSRKVPLLTLRHAQQLNPGIPAMYLLHDLVCPVGRTIAHDDPFERTACLRNHRLKSQFDDIAPHSAPA